MIESDADRSRHGGLTTPDDRDAAEVAAAAAYLAPAGDDRRGGGHVKRDVIDRDGVDPLSVTDDQRDGSHAGRVDADPHSVTDDRRDLDQTGRDVTDPVSIADNRHDVEQADRGGVGDDGTGEATVADRDDTDVDPAEEREIEAELPRSPTAQQGPKKLSQLSRGAWWGVLKRTVKEFNDDNLTDWAAALTYYGIQSIFPGLLVLVSVLGLTGQATSRRITNNITSLTPGPVRDLLQSAVANLSHQSTAGILAVVGLLGSLWSASGYIGAFMRASNAIYDVAEGRPLWKTLPIRLGVTIATGIALTAMALAVVLTGGLAQQVGKLVHLESSAVDVWDVAKWPVLLVLVSLIFALLYWASPNAHTGGFRWISPGGLLAVLIWAAASGGFALYIANFGSYNKTYGSLAAIIIFLVWLWISNVAILLGAEFNAEMQRARAIIAGHPADEEPYVQLRDERHLDPKGAKGLT